MEKFSEFLQLDEPLELNENVQAVVLPENFICFFTKLTLVKNKNKSVARSSRLSAEGKT